MGKREEQRKGEKGCVPMNMQSLFEELRPVCRMRKCLNPSPTIQRLSPSLPARTYVQRRDREERREKREERREKREERSDVSVKG